MPDYLGTPDYVHGSRARVGILLVNLGTPDGPQPPAVRRFLAEFLWDPRVIETPRWLWWLILHGFILRFRPAKSAHAYQQIWTPDGSPLMLHSRALAAAVREHMVQQFGDGVEVVLGMTYGSPSIADALEQLRRAGMRRLLVLPLYPQYSATTTGSVFDRVTRALQKWRWLPELRFVTGYHDHERYIDSVSSSIERFWQSNPRRHLLFSFHGIPRSYLEAGDPYHCECQKTARLVASRLGLGPEQWSVSFQSQVGRAEWLRPYTDKLLVEYAKNGRRQVTVVCPGFAADCLETLEEIALRNRETFLAAGGEAYDYVPALNESAAHVQCLTEILVQQAHGWPELSATAPDTTISRERALQMGAAR
jgi:ferrochelatase